MKYFLGKKGKQLLLTLFILLVFAIISSMYFRNPIVENLDTSSGSKTGTGTGISDIKSVSNLPGVGNNSIPTNENENWSMVNEIQEPDGTIVQDIINTDGTVLTITNKQNIINTGKNITTPPGSGGGGGASAGSGSSSSGSSSTYNRNTF